MRRSGDLDQMSKRVPNLALPLTGLIFALSGHAAGAQGSTFFGRVLSDSGMILVGAEVVLNGPQNLQRTNERGEFRFTAVPGGYHVVGVRMPGFSPRIDTIEVEGAGEIQRNYRLSRLEATTLPEVPVTTTPLDRKLFEFHERRKGGVGRFLDSAEFATRRGTRMSDRLASLPGVNIERFGNARFVTNARIRTPGEPGSPMCRALVWLDGVNLGTNFNVDELNPSSIIAVEWYAGTLTIPSRLAPPPRIGEPYCGVLVIWLR
jgi:hypothetical protein